MQYSASTLGRFLLLPLINPSMHWLNRSSGSGQTHMENNTMSCCWEVSIQRWHLLSNSGWSESLVEAKIALAGTADSFLTASHVTRTRYAHEVTACALYGLMMRAYDEYPLPQAAVACRELIKCGCKKRCKCRREGLRCTHLWKVRASAGLPDNGRHQTMYLSVCNYDFMCIHLCVTVFVEHFF